MKSIKKLMKKKEKKKKKKIESLNNIYKQNNFIFKI